MGETSQILIADATSKAFFDGLSVGRVRVQCCPCGVYQLGRIVCFACRGPNLEWVDASGLGQIHSFVCVRRAGHPTFEPLTPFVSALIELEEGPRLFARQHGDEPVAIGDSVRLGAHDYDGVGPAPFFKPIGTP